VRAFGKRRREPAEERGHPVPRVRRAHRPVHEEARASTVGNVEGRHSCRRHASNLGLRSPADKRAPALRTVARAEQSRRPHCRTRRSASVVREPDATPRWRLAQRSRDSRARAAPCDAREKRVARDPARRPGPCTIKREFKRRTQFIIGNQLRTINRLCLVDRGPIDPHHVAIGAAKQGAT
jgi:hypothetical protein